MSKKSKKEYLEAIRARYLSSSKKEKQIILNEVCATCGYNRKYSIRVLNRKKKREKEKICSSTNHSSNQAYPDIDESSLFKKIKGCPASLASIL